MFDWLFSSPLAVGAAAPPFELRNDRGETVRLGDYRGKKNVILIFYPGDDTRVCTQQVCEMRDNWNVARARDAVVFGVNPGSAESHRRFREKYSLPFDLLIDEGKHVASRYNAGGLIVNRTVYAIGKDGRILFAQRGKPSPDEVLAAIPVPSAP
jgi:peroxiredoxin Q/BCP